MNHQDFNWDQFFALIRAKMVIPVIGSDIIRMKDSKRSVYTHLKQGLEELLGREDKDLNLMEFVEKYEDDFLAGPQYSIKPIYDKIEIDDIDLKPLEALARIADFDFFITTDFSDIFEKVLQKERCGKEEVVNVINYSLTKYAQEKPSGNTSSVTLFNLLGDIKARDDFAMTDEEVLEYLISIKNGFEEIPQVTDALAGKSLLFIGCGFPDWLLRFTIRIISNQRFADKKIGKIIADNRTFNDPKLSSFLRHFNTNIVPIPGPQFEDTFDFMHQLAQNWTDVRSDTVKERYEGVVFLSYCNEDRDVLDSAQKALKSRGVDVWYDMDRLESGANYNERIDDEIRNCTVFVPLISEDSIRDSNRYVYDKEWKLASARKRFVNDGSFIKPFILDKTNVTDERIPETFRDVTIRSFELESFVEDIIGQLEKV